MNARTITTVRIISALIALIGAVVSYGTQRALLLGWHVDPLSAAAIPLTVDLLAIICALIIHTSGVAPAGRKVAYRVLVLAGLVSVAANALAGDTLGSRIAHVWCVLAYLAAEGVAAHVKAAPPAVPAVTDAVREKRSAAARKGAATRKANKAKATRKPRTPRVPTYAIEALLAERSEAPVSPAPYRT